jgi:hypothetical protein
VLNVVKRKALASSAHKQNVPDPITRPVRLRLVFKSIRVTSLFGMKALNIGILDLIEGAGCIELSRKHGPAAIL